MTATGPPQLTSSTADELVPLTDATPDVGDFIYVCTSHLADPGFAKPAISSSTPLTPSSTSSPAPASPANLQSEIEKIKAEYEAKLAAKDKALADAAVAKSSSSSSWLHSGLKMGYSALSSLATTKMATITTPLAPPPAPVPSPHEVNKAIELSSKVFTLHRSIFAMRQDAVKKKWQAQDARERAKGLGLPSAPISRP